jgi:cell fate regulator YaaT (PSP1 superfamily)
MIVRLPTLSKTTLKIRDRRKKRSIRTNEILDFEKFDIKMAMARIYPNACSGIRQRNFDSLKRFDYLFVL